MNGKFLTSDEEERASLELSIMIVLADKVWRRDSQFLNGREVADIVNGVFMDKLNLKLITLDGNVNSLRPNSSVKTPLYLYPSPTLKALDTKPNLSPLFGAKMQV